MILYQKILLFLIQAACYCNRGKIGHSFKDALKLNEWDKRLKDVQDAEKTVLDLDLDVKAQQTAFYQRKILTERRDEKDDACLAKLRLSDPRLDKKRIEDIKGGLLRESYSWILESHEFNAWKKDGGLLWVRGDPGKGKTMLLCGIIDELYGRKAYYFCQATNKAINSGVAVLRGLIYMMADENPHLIASIRKRLDKCNDIFDANSWYILSEVFEEMIEATEDVHVIVDALDECVEGRRELLRFILRNRAKAKWIVSSRNHSDIEEELNQAPSLSLEVNSASISQAVDRYIQYRVDQLANRKSYDLETKLFVLGYLRQNAHDTFLWVALVCTNLAETGQWVVKPTLKKFPPGLTEVYQRMWHMVLEKDSSASLLQQILTVMALVLRPLTLIELRVLVEIPNQTDAFLANVLQDCGSFLTVRQDVLEFVHQSAKEYVDGMTRGAMQKVNLEIFSRSMSAMFRALKKDVYNLECPDSSISQIRVPRPDPLAGITYSCVYWIQHLINGKRLSLVGDKNFSITEENLIRQFLIDLYLPWLEASSLLKSTGTTLMMFHDLESLVSESHQQDENGDENSMKSLIYDARRFFQYFRNILQSFPLQVYYAGILFSPEDSMLRKSFSQDGPSHLQVVKHGDIGWSPSLANLDIHHGIKNVVTTAVCFCHDTRKIAFSYSDGLVQIWQIISMEIVLENQIGVTSKGQTDVIRHIAFTQINDKVICHRNSGVVTIWDLSTNQFKDLDLESVVNISPDGHFVAQTTSSAIRIHSLWENELSFYKSVGATLYIPQYRPTLLSQDPGPSLVFSSDSSSIAARTTVHTIAVWVIHPARLRCEISTSKNRLHTMTLGAKYLATCEAHGNGTDDIHGCALVSLYDLNNSRTIWTYFLNDTDCLIDVQINVQINISSDDNFIVASNGRSYIFDSMNGTCIWRSLGSSFSWISPNLQYILSLRGHVAPGSVATLQEWANPEPGTAPSIKRKPCKESITSMSSNARRIRTFDSSGNSQCYIVDLEMNSTLWQHNLWQVQQYAVSDSMMLAVRTDTQKSNLKTNELEPRGLQIVSPTSPKGEKITHVTIAPDDSHVAMVIKSKILKIWHVNDQTEIRSVDCILSCTQLQWSADSKKLVASTNSGFILIDIEGKIDGGVLRMDGASFVAFSEATLSFVTWLHDDTDPDNEQKRPKRARKPSLSCGWPLNGKSKPGDWVEWDIVDRIGHVIENFHSLGNFRLKKLCYNSQMLVICSNEMYFFAPPMLRIWDLTSNQFMLQSLPSCIDYKSMTLEDRTLRFNCGAMSIGPGDVSFGCNEEIFYDGQWIWREGKRLARAPADYEHIFHTGSRYENKTLGLNGENGGYILLRCQ